MPQLYMLVGGVLVSLAMGFAGGWRTHSWKVAADAAETAEATAAEAARRAEQHDAAEVAFEKGRASAEVREVEVVKEVVRVVSKPVYRDMCFDADGVRILTEDIAAANARRNPAPTVPTSAPAD